MRETNVCLIHVVAIMLCLIIITRACDEKHFFPILTVFNIFLGVEFEKYNKNFILHFIFWVKLQVKKFYTYFCI